MKFTPTPKRSNLEETEEDINTFCRKLRLTEYFLDKKDEDESLVRNKSDFTPRPGRNKTLDKFIDNVRKFPIKTLNPQKKKSNINAQQWQSIQTLKNDKSIVIKEADKGGAVVIMDSAYYKDLVLKLLDDQNYYQHDPTYQTKTIMLKLNKLISEHGNGLTEKEKDYIINFDSNVSNFYGLPKVHKSKIISEECTKNPSYYSEINKPSDLKLRPIVAGPNCETHRLSNFLDILLKPLVHKVKSYINDTTDFLNNLLENTQYDTFPSM